MSSSRVDGIKNIGIKIVVVNDFVDFFVGIDVLLYKTRVKVLRVKILSIGKKRGLLLVMQNPRVKGRVIFAVGIYNVVFVRFKRHLKIPPIFLIHFLKSEQVLYALFHDAFAKGLVKKSDKPFDFVTDKRKV